MRMKNQILLYGNTRKSSDIRYFSGFSIHDDYFFFTLDGKRCALLSPLEIGRARRTSSLDVFFDFTEVCKLMPSKTPRNYFEALVFILKKNRVRSLEVPADFPSLMLEKLRERNFKVFICEGEFFPEREVKSKFELSEIAKANAVASECYKLVEAILRVSKIDKGKLFYKGKLLTSEFLRTEIECLAISLGADALDTICASGEQACDPHEVGRGGICANSLIVCDIFPRLRESGYYGDMTRTFLKGEPSQKQSALVDAVLNAQKLALTKIKAGIDGAKVHKDVCDFFEKSGYATKQIKGKWGGFFHSTGHGLGLDVHEAPSMGIRKSILESGNVITVEPGLYYSKIGGCRIEDNVVVQKNGIKMLSHYHYNWIID